VGLRYGVERLTSPETTVPNKGLAEERERERARRVTEGLSREQRTNNGRTEDLALYCYRRMDIMKSDQRKGGGGGGGGGHVITRSFVS